LEFASQPRPVDTTRTVKLDDDTTVILRNINPETDGDFLLDFTRLRNIPRLSVSDTAGNEDWINFDGNKRPAEYTVATFDTNTRVLAIHEVAHGISSGMLCKYLQMLLPELGKFRFDPIIEQRASDLLMKSGAFAKFTVSLAHMGNEERMRSLGLADDEVLDLIRMYASPNISVSLSIDPKSSSRTLAVEKIRNLTSALLGLDKRHVKKLSLVVEEAGEMFPVNLLKDRIMETEELNADEAEVTDEIRYRAIRNAWGARKNELRNRYKDVE
jgi:hypothetical protein